MAVHEEDYYRDYYYEDEDDPPPPIVVHKKKKETTFDTEVTEDDVEAARRHARTLTNNLLDDFDAAQRSSHKSDKMALSNAEKILHESHKPPIGTTSIARKPQVNYHRRRVDRLITETEEELPTLHLRAHAKPRTEGHDVLLPPPERPKPSASLDIYIPPYEHVPRTRRSRSVGGQYNVVSHAKHLASPQANKKNGHSDTVYQQRKAIERRLEGLLDYELPTGNAFKEMRQNLQDVNDKMASHRIMLDRYSGLDMRDPETVESRVEAKCQQMMDRMPETRRSKPHERSDEELEIYYYSPNTTHGYHQGLVEPTGSQASELRGRIRRLLCRSKNDPHYYRY